MPQANFKYSIALILACVSLMAAPGLATVNNNPGVGDCLSTIQSVNSCVQEIVASFLSFRINLLGIECCKAFNEVDNECWPKVFPLDPFFPPLLKRHCQTIVKVNTPPSSTTDLQHAPPSPKTTVAPVLAPGSKQGASPPPPATDSTTEQTAPPSTTEQKAPLSPTTIASPVPSPVIEQCASSPPP